MVVNRITLLFTLPQRVQRTEKLDVFQVVMRQEFPDTSHKRIIFGQDLLGIGKPCTQFLHIVEIALIYLSLVGDDQHIARAFVRSAKRNKIAQLVEEELIVRPSGHL